MVADRPATTIDWRARIMNVKISSSYGAQIIIQILFEKNLINEETAKAAIEKINTIK